MLTELLQPRPMLTPKGRAWAWFVIDYGTEHNLLWVCIVCSTGECWTFDNRLVRAEPNFTMGITNELNT